MVDVPASFQIVLAIYISLGNAIAVGRAKVGSPKYEGPSQGLTKGKQWDYQDHGVSWAMGQCNSGIHQSPIALPVEITNETKTDKTFYYRYKQIDHEVELFNDGYMFTITCPACTGGFGIGESTVIDGQPLEVDSKYALELVVIHSPSEHTWSGEHLPLEVQLIHRKTDDSQSQGIVSIGFNHGMDEVNEHPFLAALLEQDPTLVERSSTEVNKSPQHSLDFASLIGDGSGMWSYDGSMTVPSCKTNVKWFVRQHYHEAPEPQIKKFVDAISQMTSQTGNNRVIQPLTDRHVRLMQATDATTMETTEEKLKKSEKQSAPATVAVLVPDADDEDAVVTASSVDVDPSLDEGWRKKQEKLGSFMINTFQQILNTFDRDTILQYTDKILDTDKAEVEARADVQAKTEERDAASQVMGPACDFTEDTATRAKIHSCDMAKSVVEDKEVELQAAQKILNERTVQVETEIRAAQAAVKKEMVVEAKQTSAGAFRWWPPNPMKTVASVPHDIHQLKVAVPQGDVNDPFSTDCAETQSRIDSENPMVADHLTPNLDQSADVPGIHFTESDENDPDVMAPEDGEDDDDEPEALLLQTRFRR
jgi:carbonic anhydrase